jgi:Tfp pilus assembly protein PilF
MVVSQDDVLRVERERENASLQVPATHRREVKRSKWRSWLLIYWAIVGGFFTVFQVLQSTLLAWLSTGATNAIVVISLLLALILTVVIARRQKTPTEKLVLAKTCWVEARRHFGDKRYEEAEAAAEQSVAYDPEEWRTWNLLGRIRESLGKPSKAIEAYTRAISTNMVSEWEGIYRNNRAVACIMNRDFGRAINDLNFCVAQNPRKSGRWRWRALAYLYLRDLSPALSDAKRSVELTNCVSNQAVLAIVARAAGDENLAAKAERRAKLLSCDESADYYYLAVLKADPGQPDEALRLLNVSIQRDDKWRARARFDPLWTPLGDNPHFVSLVDATPEAKET